MTKEELNHILYNISYYDYTNRLKEKYGIVPKDYCYIATKGKTKGQLVKNTGITRGKEGLYIHHILENLFIDLSNLENYSKMLDEVKDNELVFNVLSKAQNSEYLCYCNLLEHLILHIKIALEYQREQFKVGIRLISMDVTRYYDLGDTNCIESTFSAKSHQWKQQVYYNIKDDYEIYVELCKIGILQLKLSPSIFIFDYYDIPYKKLLNDLNKDKIIKKIIKKDKMTKIKLKQYEDALKAFLSKEN